MEGIDLSIFWFLWKFLSQWRKKEKGERTRNLCLVLLFYQNSFGRSKMVLVWPNWFGLDHNDLVTTIMKWSQPKWIGQVQIVIFYQNESQFGPDQFILVVTISLWSSPNQFGQTKTILGRPKLFWSHRRTRQPTSAKRSFLETT